MIAGRGRGIDVMRRRGRGQRVGAHSRERRGAARRKKSVLGRGGAWRNTGARRKSLCWEEEVLGGTRDRRQRGVLM